MEGADSSSLSAKSPNCYWDNKWPTSIAFVPVPSLTFNILHRSFNFETVSPNNSLFSCALSAELFSWSFAKTWSNVLYKFDWLRTLQHFTVGFLPTVTSVCKWSICTICPEMNLTTSLTSPEKFVCHSGKWFQAVVHVNMFVWLHICNCMYVYTIQCKLQFTPLI